MKYFVVFLCVLFLSCSSSSNISDTPVKEFARMHAAYLLNAEVDAVVRDYSMNLRIMSKSKSVLNVKRAVTILNVNARDQGYLAIEYDKFRKIENVKAAVYDRNGNFIRSLDSNDIEDFSATSAYSLYEDNRIRTYQLYHDQYPYTVTFDYTLELNGLLHLPTWYPQGKNEYVEKASLSVTSPPNLEFRHKAFNFDITPRKESFGKDSVLVWETEDLPPVKNEPFSPPLQEQVPRIMMAMSEFDMEGNPGKMDTWSNFGEWYYDLSKGRNILPPSVQQQVHKIFKSAQTREEGINSLYKYMQQKTRYVSIQLGIGGWRPYDATFVEEKGYGDCKALTNYMKSLLAYAGVESYPVLVRNGISEPDIISDFPSNQFNHVVLCVPGNDTIWLECTNKHMPFNYIGFSNANRQGLIVKEDTAHLISTPTYDHRVNKRRSKVEVHLNSAGDAGLDIKNTFSGYFLDKTLAELAGKSEQDRQKWLYRTIPLNTFEIRHTYFREIDQKKKSPTVRYQLKSKRFGTLTGSRLFVPVNKLYRWSSLPSNSDAERRLHTSMRISFSESDEIVIHIPEGFVIEALPQNVDLKTDFAKYSLHIKLSKSSQIRITRSLIFHRKELDANQYSNLKTFLDKVYTTDRQILVLKQN